MQIWKKNFSLPFIFFIVCLFFVGIWIRTIHLEKFNLIREDEKLWILSGTSLLEKGIPESWTVFWTTYGEYHWSYLGNDPTVVVRPFLDHTPLFELMVGKWAVLTGNNTSEAFDWKTLRSPMIVIAFLLIGMTSLLVGRIFNARWGLLTFVSFLFLPSHILASRIIAAEHLLGLCMVGVMAVCYEYLQSKNEKNKRLKNGLFIALVVLSFIAPLLKLSGVIVPLIASILLLSKKKYYATGAVILAFVLSILVYIIYGCYYDCSLFWSIMQQHGLRPQTYWYVFTFFSKPDLGYFQLNDPLMLVGLVGSLFFVLQPEQKEEQSKRIYLAAPVSMIFLLFLTIAPVELYGWYKFLAFPIIAIGLGYVWDRLFAREYTWLILIAPAVLVLIENVFILDPSSSLLRKILIACIFLPGPFFFIKPEMVKKPAYTLWIFVLLLLTATLQGIWSINLLNSF